MVFQTNSLKKLTLLVGIFCFSLQADNIAELTLTRTGLRDTNGQQSDIKIVVKTGNFPYDGADIIVNDAKPSLLGFMDANGSPIDKTVFNAAGSMITQRGRLEFLRGHGNTQLRAQVRSLFDADNLIEDNRGILIVKNDISVPNRDEINNLLEFGVQYFDEQAASDGTKNIVRIDRNTLTALTPHNNLLKKYIDEQRVQNKFSAISQAGDVVITPAYNLKDVRMIFHAVMPQGNQPEILKKAVKGSMEKVLTYDKLCLTKNYARVRHIAFPSLATHYGFDLKNAASLIISAVAGFIQSNGNGVLPIQEVRFIVSDEREFNEYRNALEEYARMRKFEQANRNALIYQDIKEDDDLESMPLGADVNNCKVPKTRRVIRTLTAQPTSTTSIAATVKNVKSIKSAKLGVQFAFQQELITIPQTEQGDDAQGLITSVTLKPEGSEYKGFWKRLRTINGETHITALPGILWAACKDGWNGPQKTTKPRRRSTKVQTQPSSWGAWMNRNFNALCLTGLVGSIAAWKWLS